MNIILKMPAKRVADILTTAICSGYSRYWCSGVGLATKNGMLPKEPKAGHYWYEDASLFDGFSTFTITVIETEGTVTGRPKTHRLSRESFEKGIARMAMKNGDHFGQWMKGNEDGPCADVFLQYVALGEVRYG